MPVNEFNKTAVEQADASLMLASPPQLRAAAAAAAQFNHTKFRLDVVRPAHFHTEANTASPLCIRRVRHLLSQLRFFLANHHLSLRPPSPSTSYTHHLLSQLKQCLISPLSFVFEPLKRATIRTASALL